MRNPRFRDRLRYRVDRFFQSGFTFQVFISFSIVVAIIFVYSVLAHFLGVLPGRDFDVDAEDLAAGREPFWPSVRFWWVLTHIFDTYWVERGSLEQFLSIALTLLNYLVFAGLVGLVGSKLAERLERVRRGTSRIVESGHIVILGWSDKVVPIVRQLIAGLDLKGTAIAILSERPMEDIESELRREFGKKQRVRWAIRTGSPTDVSDLRLLSLQTARTIIVLQPGEEVQGDSRVIKSIVTIAHTLGDAASMKGAPSLIAEIEQSAMHAIARAAAHGLCLSIVHPSEYIAKVILQTGRQRGLASVYEELLAYDGSEFYIRRQPGLDGMRWSDVAFAFEDALPVGFLHEGRTTLLPHSAERAAVCPPGASIIALARDQRALDRMSPSAPMVLPTGRRERGAIQPARRLLLLGYDQKIPRMLHETNEYARALGESFTVCLVSPHYARNPVGDTKTPFAGEYAHLDIEVIPRDPLVSGVLESLHPDSFDVIIIIGEHAATETVEDIDTRSIMILLLLHARRREGGGDCAAIAHRQIVVEIHHHETARSRRRSRANTT
ncbi:MAG: hypothetical protein IPP94_18280 [Ignavibacteria bacterium]|nr:hypothetical protein [Ignavibacteria bacterium]